LTLDDHPIEIKAIMNTSEQEKATLALIVRLEILSSEVGKSLTWLTRVMMEGLESSGALTAEISPQAFSDEAHWVLVLRFRSRESIQEWQKSEGHRKLWDELTPDIENKRVTLTESIDLTYATGRSVTVAVETHVKEGGEKAYFACEGKYQAAQAQKPGYRGTYVQPPTNSKAGIWTTLIQFDSQDVMTQWFSSEERKNLVSATQEHVKLIHFRNVETSFPGWFKTETDEEKEPANWKIALLILLGLYPCVMLFIKFGMPFLQNVPFAVANFVGNTITVALTTWLTMPLFIKFFQSWLFPNENTSKWANAVSVTLIFILFAIEIAIFWRYY